MSLDLYRLAGSAQTALINPARLVEVTAPAVEPWLVTDAEVQHHLRLDSEDDSAYVTLLLKSARKYLERRLGRCFINTELRAEWDHLPRVGTYVGAAFARELVLPRAPFVSVASVQYRETTAGTVTAFSAANYTVGSDLDPATFGRLWLNDTASWPDIGSYPGALRCTFTAGYGETATTIPEDLRLALLWLTAWWYEERQPVNVGNIVNALPAHLEALIDQHRVAALA